MAEKAENVPESSSFLSGVASEIFQSPLNLALLGLIGFLIYRIIKSRQDEQRTEPEEKPLPKMKKKDFTVEELRKYDGIQGEGRVLIAVNGKVYDVTKGKRFYGPGGPYAAFAGRDASRGLATFNVGSVSDTYDELTDLSTEEMDSIREWELQFKEKYDFVGRLLKPREEPTNYSDEEDESNAEKSKDD